MQMGIQGGVPVRVCDVDNITISAWAHGYARDVSALGSENGVTYFIISANINTRMKMCGAQFTHVAGQRSGLTGFYRIQEFLFFRKTDFRFTKLC